MKKVFKIEGFEGMLDLEDMFERFLEEKDIPGDFDGTIKMTLEYIPWVDEDEDDDE